MFGMQWNLIVYLTENLFAKQKHVETNKQNTTLVQCFGAEGCVGPKILSGLRTEVKNLLPQLGTEAKFLGLWNRRLFTILNDLTKLVLVYIQGTWKCIWKMMLQEIYEAQNKN